MAGLTAARSLAETGMAVMLVDKGRAVGGRMATRRIGDATFDHGAQHISARTTPFGDAMALLVHADIARVWFRSESATRPDRGIENRYCGVGGMRRIPEAFAEGLVVTTGVRIDRLTVDTDGVKAFDGGACVATADAAVLTPPVPQTLALLRTGSLGGDNAVSSLDRLEYDATLAVMAVLDAPTDLPDGHLAFDAGPVGWIADNQHKGVSAVPAITIHSSPRFAAEYLEEESDRWMAALLAAARPFHRGAVTKAVAHRWRFAQPRFTLDVGAVSLDAPSPVVLAGEVFAGARVEGAYTSGRVAAQLMVDQIG